MASLLLASAASAEPPAIEVETAECLVNEANVALYAQVEPEIGGSSVRLYFRRLNPEGAFYFVEMNPSGAGAYWTTFLRPEERGQPPLTDDWWRELESRDWVTTLDCAEAHPDDLQECWAAWLDRQEHEAAEYYVTVHDAEENQLARSETFLVPVLRPPAPDTETGRQEPTGKVCDPPPLSSQESGWAANIVVGETVEDQRRNRVFHWRCYGVVARIDWMTIPRPDEICRRCVVGDLALPGKPSSELQLAQAGSLDCAPRRSAVDPDLIR